MKRKGFVAVILLSLCILGSSAAETNPAGGLELSFSTSRGWGGLPVFCNPVKASDGAPSTAGARFAAEGVAPETGKFLDGKCYLIVKDGEGEIFSFVVAAQIYPDLLTGPVTRELTPVANTSIDLFTNSIGSEAPAPGRKTISELLGGKSGNGAIDGPVSLAGLFIVMRGACENARLKILEIQFDGKTVETFKDNHNGWYVPECKEHKEDYEKFGPGFNVTVAGESLTPSSSLSPSASPAVIDYSKASSPAPADYSKPSGARLEVTVFQPRTWSSLVIGPKEPIQFPEVPRMFGFYTNGDSSSSIKTFVILRDARGVDYEFLVSTVLYGGYTEVVVLGAAGKPGQEDKPVFFTDAKPPFTFYGFDFYCRKPLPETTLYFDNIAVDGKLIEGFDKDNKWEVKLKPEDSECLVRLSKEGERAVAADIFPERQENIIVNSSVEGGLEGWEYANAQYIPKDITGKPIVSMSEHGGRYKWEDEGVESFHSMSMEADTPGKWAGIFTIVKGIKPNTSYVLTFAHRMSQPSGFSLSIFGKSIDVQETFRENPEHWVKFTRAFKSGDYQGDIPIGFYVKSQDVPIKVGIDEVEMYEGFSPIGYDLARLHLYYYNHAYVSPDMALPVRFQMETLFSDGKAPNEFSYVFELPEEVRWDGFWCRWSFFSGLESAMSAGKLSKEPIEIDGKGYIRYSFTLPLQEGYRKQFVTASARADMHGYSGCKTFTAFLGTNEQQGEFSGYYYARWPGGEQAKRKFLIKTVRVDKIGPFKRFEANLSVDRGDVKYGPQFSRTMLSLGIEGFTVHQRDADIIKVSQDAGIKRFSQFMNMPCFDVKDDSVAGSGDDKPSRNCLSYRGNYWKRGVAALTSDIGYGFTDFILDDAPEVACYCKECTDAFKDFLSLHTELPYKNPRSFGSGDVEYTTLWKEFSLWHYGMTAKSLRDELRAYADEKYPGRRIRIASSSLPAALSSIKHPFSADGIKEGLDYYTGQWYINWAYGHQGSPIFMGDRISVEYKAMGEYAPPLMPNLGPGLDFTNPFNSLDPHEVMKYQMLEMAFAIPMAGYHIYSAEDVDGGDLKYLAEFNKIVSEHEDIIIDGKPVAGVSCSGLRSSARLKELNGKYLLLVSNYSTYKETPTVVTVTLPFAPKARLKDVETGDAVTTLKGDTGTFDVTLSKSRARIFSFDPI